MAYFNIQKYNDNLYQIKDGKLTFITDSTSVAGELFILEKHGVSSADSLKPWYQGSYWEGRILILLSR